MFDESKHPRDERGRFTDGAPTRRYAQNMSYAEIIREDRERERELVKISLGFFAEKALESQTPREIRKGVRALNKRIVEHEKKIQNPSAVYSDWETTPEKQKISKLNHWKNELKIFKINVENRIKRLKELEESEE